MKFKKSLIDHEVLSTAKLRYAPICVNNSSNWTEVNSAGCTFMCPGKGTDVVSCYLEHSDITTLMDRF